MSAAAAAVPGVIPRWQIARAVPAGSRRARWQRAWTDEVLADDEFLAWRRDRRENWEAVIRALAAYMDWETSTSRPTWSRLAARAARRGRPLHRATVARCLAWLRRRGYLGVAESGSTPFVRAGVLHGLADAAEGNRAATYVLAVKGRASEKRAIRATAAKHPEGIATLSEQRSCSIAPSCAREGRGQVKSQVQGESERPSGAQPPVLPRPGRAALAAIPETRSEGLSSAGAVRTATAVLQRLSAAHIRHLARPYQAAGWSGADLVHALNHLPSGRTYGFTGAVRHPAAWTRHRLAAWLAPDGTVRPSASQVRAAAAAAVRAEQETRRAAETAVAARTASPAAAHGYAQRARAELAAKSSRARAAIVQGAADVRATARAAVKPDSRGGGEL